jgi:hypothetical protein
MMTIGYSCETVSHMKNTPQNKPNYSIVKHNDLIEARYKLTLHEQKLVMTVAMMIKPEDRDFYGIFFDPSMMD